MYIIIFFILIIYLFYNLILINQQEYDVMDVINVIKVLKIMLIYYDQDNILIINKKVDEIMEV